METTTSPAVWTSILRELKSSSPSGEKYSRTAEVEDEIHRVLRLHESEWTTEAPNLKNETIVFLLQLVRSAGGQLFCGLSQELSVRIARISKRVTARFGLDENVTEEIVKEVDLKVLELVLTDTPGRQTAVLEFAFGQAVKRRARDLSRKYKNSVQAHLGWIDIPAGYDDGSAADEASEGLKLIPDTGPSPETIVINRLLLDKAWAVIDDPRVYKVLFLHYCKGWSIEALMESLGATRPQIKYMRDKGLQQMRAAIGGAK